MPAPGSAYVMQDLSYSSSTYSDFEFWVLRFRDLGASFSSFGCFVLRFSFSSASFSKLTVFRGICGEIFTLFQACVGNRPCHGFRSHLGRVGKRVKTYNVCMRI